MKKLILIAILCLFTQKGFSQYSNFSFELNYPMMLDNNFIGENYNGLLDLGIDYTFTNSNPVNFGISINGGALQNNSNKNVGNSFKVTCYTIKPRLFAAMNPLYYNGFSPSIGLGYSVFIFDISGSNDYSDEPSDSQNGFNLNLGFGYDFSDRFFAQVQYDFVNLGVQEDVPDVKYNKHVNILKIGLGYRL